MKKTSNGEKRTANGQKKIKPLRAVGDGAPNSAEKESSKAVWQAHFEAAQKLPGANDRTISDLPLKPIYDRSDLTGLACDLA